MGVSREGKIFSSRKNIFKFIHFFLLFLSCYCSCYCEARLFGNIPPSRGGGGILFGGGGGGGGGEHDRAQQAGPGIGKHPPQNILGRISTTDDEDEDVRVEDPRRPPKNARMRLGPILFDPEHLVYDDNDDYSEDGENERNEEPVRPRLGFDLFSVFVPVSNFFSVLWKVFCNFVLKLEKQVNRMMGREAQDGQMSVLLVVSVAWFIFGSVVVVVNQLVNRLIRDPDEDPNEVPTDGRFLRIPTLSSSPPTVETTPPTPTSSTTDLDGVDPPKRRRTESPRHFRRSISSKVSPCVTPIKRQRNVTLGSSQLSESRILRRRERDRVKQEFAESSVLGLFQQRICDEDISTATVEWLDETLHLICRDRYSRQKFESLLIQAANQRIAVSVCKTFSTNSLPGPPMVELISLKNLSFSELKKVQMGTSLEQKTLTFTFDVAVSVTLVVNLIPPPSDVDKVVETTSAIVIDNLTTQIEIQVVGGALPTEDLNLSTFRFRQSGFADVKLHWEHPSTLEAGCEALTDLAEEVVLEAVRNTELKILLADLLFHERELDLDNQDSDSLEVTLVRASNLQIFRNINNNKTCSNPTRSVESCRPYITLEVDRPCQSFKTDLKDAIFQPDSSDIVWKQSQFKISVIRGFTQELLVEVWNAGDTPEPTFLGLCLFPVYDLTSSTPTQTRTVTLQRRPFEEDSAVSDLLCQSTITLMFRFSLTDESASESLSLYRGVHKISEIRRSTGPGGQPVRTASTTYIIGSNAKDPSRGLTSPAKRNGKFAQTDSSSPAKDADQLRYIHQLNSVALAALNDLTIQRSQGKSGTSVERTTLFIRSVQKLDGDTEPTNGHADTSKSDEETAAGAAAVQDDAKTPDSPPKEATTSSPSTPRHSTTTTSTSGTKQKKGILSSLKKKFYKSPKKKEEKGSTDQKRPAVIAEEGESDSTSSCSDCSSERSFELSDWRGRLSLSWESLASESGSAALLAPIVATCDDASSLSDVSGISVTSISFRSGAFEEASSSNSESIVGAPVSGGPSALVLETVEHGFRRHYLIPSQLVKLGNNKLRKRGRKLHLAMDHVFVARHVKGSPSCSVCRRRIAARLGKQGYMCRGCNLICHKSCHDKVENLCSHSSIGSMELFRGSTLMKS